MYLERLNSLPPYPNFEPGIRRAPSRGFRLTESQTKVALMNALRYVPVKFHEELAPEFLDELIKYGRIYAYRFRPQGRIWGQPIDEYKGKCLAGKAFQVMIDNNLDFEVALYPYELVTYGETGSVCQNWLQYNLIKHYLEELTEDTCLVLASGHPAGLFPSRPEAPRVVITNALMIGEYDNPADWEIAEQMGVANYGQMTAGGWMYIGPQGIVHGTFNTLLTAGRKQLGISDDGDLTGKLFVSSGLGGMSGAQPKATSIAGAVGIFAEVDKSRIETRLKQGWVDRSSENLQEVVAEALAAKCEGRSMTIAYHGNIVDLLQYLVDQQVEVDLLSDQTSCHAVYEGGYCPHSLTFEERTEMLATDRAEFIKRVDATLKYHYELIKILVERGTYFFDYGNSFLKAIFDTGVKEISRNGIDDRDGFIYPSYVEDLMGPELFDYGYGPFRWVCLSGNENDLKLTDQVAMECIDPDRRGQDRDNYIWIRDAEKNKMVVGTQARILYQDEEGRVRIAHAFNKLVRESKAGPIMLGRDHHDVSGTDSPFRETANIKDGSNVMADMATHCFAGNAARGMSLCALHNGGGVGIGKSINGGFGLLLDGSERVDRIIDDALQWDVMSGIARRSWARNPNAITTAEKWNERHDDGKITLPYLADKNLIDRVVAKSTEEKNCKK
ncbi:MAG: urocanate hydratase [Clostridiaceae bacterium]|jgi:urocanate hydratase|nr:urocanate hydratase [Clostridiaceae bacterium]